MTALKVLLEEGNIEYKESHLAINSSGLIVGLSEKTFVSFSELVHTCIAMNTSSQSALIYI